MKKILVILVLFTACKKKTTTPTPPVEEDNYVRVSKAVTIKLISHCGELLYIKYFDKIYGSSIDSTKQFFQKGSDTLTINFNYKGRYLVCNYGTTPCSYVNFKMFVDGALKSTTGEINPTILVDLYK